MTFSFIFTLSTMYFTYIYTYTSTTPSQYPSSNNSTQYPSSSCTNHGSHTYCISNIVFLLFTTHISYTSYFYYYNTNNTYKLILSPPSLYHYPPILPLYIYIYFKIHVLISFHLYHHSIPLTILCILLIPCFHLLSSISSHHTSYHSMYTSNSMFSSPSIYITTPYLLPFYVYF